MECLFTIHARDEAGNHLLDGGLKFAVSVYPDVDEDATASVLALKVDCTVRDLNNGVYACSYKPMVAGLHKVRVQLANKHIRGSPFAAMVYELPDWETEEVAQWVEGLGYPQYSEVAPPPRFGPMRCRVLTSGLGVSLPAFHQGWDSWTHAAWDDERPA